MVDQIINLLITLYLPVVITAVVGFVGYEARKLLPALRGAVSVWTKTHLDAHEQQLLTDLVMQGVTAAEQVASNPEVQAAAGYKLSAALKYVKGMAARYGISVDDGALRAMIEAAVYDQFNWKKDPGHHVVGESADDTSVPLLLDTPDVPVQSVEAVEPETLPL